MSVQKNGSVSKDFPLYHTNLIPIHINIEKPHSKRQKNKFILTNEHPDFFKLDGMKEEGYKNPYLKEVIKFDRNEYYKNIDTERRQINLINFINSNRKYSQDPKVIRYITNANTKELNKKREQILKDKMKIKKRSFTQDNNIRQIAIRDKILDKLEKYIPKIDYKMTSTIDYSKPIQTEYQTLNEKNNFKNEENNRINKNILKKYNFFFDDQKTSYLKNFNDYNISEAQQRDLYKGLNYQRKPSLKYNVIRGQYNMINPPLYRGENWGTFHENYYTIENNRNQFRIKGGLFSEFTDKNINVISINKRELKKKVEKERELRNNLKNNKYMTINNNSNFSNAFH